MLKKVILVIFLGIFLTGCGKNNFSDMKENKENDVEIIGVNDVKQISDNYKESSSVRIVDVRTYEEFSSGHIKNAINIPLDEIENIDVSKDKEIIVYCRSGSRSYQAALILSDLGYDVKDMGGLSSWVYELES